MSSLPAKPKLRKGKYTPRNEDPVHFSVKEYLERTLPGDWLVHHSRNGGKDKAENGRAKKLGTKSGWPDLEIAGCLNGCPWVGFLEVKDQTGIVEPHQRRLHEQLRALGFNVAVVRSIEDTRACVLEWGLPSKDTAVNDNADTWQPLGDVAGNIIKGVR